MRDPYDVLGVQRGATQAAIKSAFRKLAKKLHPDANKNNPKAAEQFAELNTAYEILGDETKRKAFDRGEIDAEGKPRFQGFEGAHPGGGFHPGGFSETFTWGPQQGYQRSGAGRAGAGARGGNFEDILNEMLGGMAGARGRRTQFEPEDFAGAPPGAAPGGRDISANVTVTLEDLARGEPVHVRLPTGKEVAVKIPAGLNEGQQIRLKGQGMPGAGGAGDALITVSVARHKVFERDGANLRLDLPITLYEAVLGGKVRVPTLSGAVELAIPAGTNSGRTFRLKGKGLPAKDGKAGAMGDLMATIRIMLPDNNDPDLEELMKKWRDLKPYDPRRDLG